MILAVLTALLGLIIGLLPAGYGLEENYGLNLLFNLRGARHPPQEVVVISEDDVSAEALNLSHDPKRWPRSYYAHLIDRLVDDGVRVIAFDYYFSEPGPPDDDALLATSLKKAGNVVLTGNLETQFMPLKDGSGHVTSRMMVEKLIPPTSELADAADSIAPFPLPKVPVSVSQYWIFKKTVDVPTLPAVALQVYALRSYDELTVLLQKALANPAVANVSDPQDRSAVAAARRLVAMDGTGIYGFDAVNGLARSMKAIFLDDTLIADLIMKEMDNPTNSVTETRDIAVLKKLVKMYSNGSSRYLNFYGPPLTITTVPFAQALQFNHPIGVNGNMVDLKGKTVFIGESNSAAQRPGDTYHTVFSRPDGSDLSGVEIAATAFANLLEDNPVRPLGVLGYLATLAAFGVAIGLLCFLLGPIIAAISTALVILAYLGFSYSLFAANGTWIPLIIPTTIQAPLAFTAAVLWKYLDARKIEVAHEQLKEMDRLKTMFLSQVSHELKTPLSSIKGFVDNMLDGLTGELQGKQREYLDRIRSNTERLTRMITNLLDLSRIESKTHSLDKVPVRIYDLAEEAAKQFHLIAASKRIAIKLVCPDTTIQVLADHDKFIQVITNLIDNAIKFTPAGGDITITIKRLDLKRVLLAVKDSGVGIPEDVLKNHLFEPFYQAKQLPGTHVTGLGLGLSIVKTLVELHDGTVSIDSKVGLGTEFCIVMPAIKRQTDAADTTSPALTRDEPPNQALPPSDQGLVDLQNYARYKVKD
jgi:signal transduction histidine kinase